jgi:hypothetical protein
MLNKVFANLFTRSYGSDIEKYIASKDPKSAADVEYWVKQYSYSNSRDMM